MINHDRWINSLPKGNLKIEEKTNELDRYRWVNTVPKKKNYNYVKKYSLMTILFVGGLLFVSALKNETRNLQKEINNLEASINVTKFNLEQAILDNEVITSPGNISKLAREYLSINLTSYKKSQIKNLNDNEKKISKVDKIKNKKINNKKIRNLQASLKTQIGKEIKKKKTEIKKIKELYSNPASIPKEVKTTVSKKIKEEKKNIKNIYDSPKDLITLERAGKWGIVQVVKVFLGIPVMPGR